MLFGKISSLPGKDTAVVNNTFFNLMKTENPAIILKLCIYINEILKVKDKEVQVGKDQEKAQSEKDSHSKNRGGKKPN